MAQYASAGRQRTSRKRKYELRRRAERQQETRRRIVEATVALHEELGPLRTSINAIAKRAGVQRPTVRAHFPDLPALLAACSSLFFARNPAPDPDRWRAIPDPRTRLREALGELYAFYGRNERMLGCITRDAQLAPNLVGVPYRGLLARMRPVLSTGWRVEPGRRPLFAAALGHALEFTTWRSLVRDRGLRNTQAAALMLALVGGRDTGGRYPAAARARRVPGAGLRLRAGGLR